MPALRAQLPFAGRRDGPQTPIPGLPKPPPSPVLSPDEAVKTLQLAPGFKAELTASEPMVQDPVWMSFDEDGRLFVVEMRGFMPDINRRGEFDETGRIALLEDADGDGRFEKSTVFVDKLVLPRTVTAMNGGIFYVSASKLWFAQDTDGDGKVDRIEVVDPSYAAFGNVEHAPNGFVRAMDNWIYNAKSQFRYRLFGNVLVKQRTEFRGQWGMSQDNYGRLIYNVNNSQLLGDVTSPNYMGRNPHHRTTAGLNLAISTNQHVFTIRMNTAVNRGYLTNVLDMSGKLREFSGSCSPVIYRGDNYPSEFQGDAFVCDPSANLIKRNVVIDEGLSLTSRFAYDDSEFLASTDERFRPVNLFNGPDGALWVVDMYRGIIQYGIFMTPYLRRETLERGLDKGIHLGRIYRIVSTSRAPLKPPRLSRESPTQWVARLKHPNGWIRDTAQRLLVERGDRSVVPDLIEMALHETNSYGRIHALWTLEGLFVELPKESIHANTAPDGPTTESNAVAAASTEVSVQLRDVGPELSLRAPSLTPEVWEACLKALADANTKVRVAAVRVAESLAGASDARGRVMLEKLMQLENPIAPELAFQSVLTAGNLPKPDALPVLARLATQSAEYPLVREALVSGVADWEFQLLEILLASSAWNEPGPGRPELLQALSSAVVKSRRPDKAAALLALAAGQSKTQRWRKRSLLDGVAANAQNRAFQPIPLETAPPALDLLARSEDPQQSAQAGEIQRVFSWPGHESARPLTSPETRRPLSPREEATFADGKLLFQQICAGCHGQNGEGVTPLAPPLVNSDWVLGPESRLIRIVLHGATAPIRVDQTRYEPPRTLPEMPGLAALENFQIAAVLNYIRRDWGHDAPSVSPSQVGRVRSETENRQTPWTEDELLQIK